MNTHIFIITQNRLRFCGILASNSGLTLGRGWTGQLVGSYDDATVRSFVYLFFCFWVFVSLSFLFIYFIGFFCLTIYFIGNFDFFLFISLVFFICLFILFSFFIYFIVNSYFILLTMFNSWRRCGGIRWFFFYTYRQSRKRDSWFVVFVVFLIEWDEGHVETRMLCARL